MRHPVRITEGHTIRDLRDRAGYTQRAFARLVGTTSGNLSHIERGATQPSPRLRNKIAEALGVDIDVISYVPQRHPTTTDKPTGIHKEASRLTPGLAVAQPSPASSEHPSRSRSHRRR